MTKQRAQSVRRGPWQAFVHRHGWRAYALPLLTAVTIVEVVRLGPGADASPAVRIVAAAPVHRSSPRPAASHPAASHPAASHPAASHPAASHPAATRPVAQASAPPTATPTATASGSASPCAGSTVAQLVVVSIQKQHAWMCAGSAEVYTTAVTTGASDLGLATPVGTWQVQDRQTDRYLVGPGYRDYVKYWVPFDGDFGFHDASWQTMAYGSPGYRSQGSHGCVHLPEAAMSWLYGWAQVGATVTVQA